MLKWRLISRQPGFSFLDPTIMVMFIFNRMFFIHANSSFLVRVSQEASCAFITNPLSQGSSSG